MTAKMFSQALFCFKGTFSMQVKDGSKPYYVSPRCVAYAIQQPFKDALD